MPRSYRFPAVRAIVVAWLFLCTKGRRESVQSLVAPALDAPAAGDNELLSASLNGALQEPKLYVVNDEKVLYRFANRDGRPRLMNSLPDLDFRPASRVVRPVKYVKFREEDEEPQEWLECPNRRWLPLREVQPIDDYVKRATFWTFRGAEAVMKELLKDFCMNKDGIENPPGWDEQGPGQAAAASAPADDDDESAAGDATEPEPRRVVFYDRAGQNCSILYNPGCLCCDPLSQLERECKLQPGTDVDYLEWWQAQGWPKEEEGISIKEIQRLFFLETFGPRIVAQISTQTNTIENPEMEILHSAPHECEIASCESYAEAARRCFEELELKERPGFVEALAWWICRAEAESSEPVVRVSGHIDEVRREWTEAGRPSCP